VREIPIVARAKTSFGFAEDLNNTLIITRQKNFSREVENTLEKY